jgi:hypothetical protein
MNCISLHTLSGSLAGTFPKTAIVEKNHIIVISIKIFAYFAQPLMLLFHENIKSTRQDFLEKVQAIDQHSFDIEEQFLKGTSYW